MAKIGLLSSNDRIDYGNLEAVELVERGQSMSQTVKSRLFDLGPDEATR